MPPNQKNTLPSIMQPAPRAGTAISRGPFLAGSDITFYGPGQPPDAGSDYRPPGDWPRAGNLLRVPQVVNLVVTVPYPYYQSPALTLGLNYSGPFLLSLSGQRLVQWVDNMFINSATTAWNGDAIPATFDGSSVTVKSAQGQIFSDGAMEIVIVLTAGGVDHIWKDVFVASGSPPGGSGWYGGYQRAIANPFPAERFRLLDVFNKVKTKIEGVRPGITFVNVIDPWQPYLDNPPPASSVSPWTNYGTDNAPVPLLGGGYFHFGWQAKYFKHHPGYYWPQLAPARTGPYFGTNWLHIYCGAPATTEQIMQDPTNSSDATPAGLARDRTLPLIQNAKQWFAGLTVRYFGLALPIATLPAQGAQTVTLADDPDFTVASFTDEDGPQSYIFGASPSTGGSTFPWSANSTLGSQQAFVNALNVNTNAQIAGINASNAAMQANLNSMLRADAASLALSGIDANYVGDTNLITDAEYLVKLIAAHYVFDKESGRDL